MQCYFSQNLFQIAEKLISDAAWICFCKTSQRIFFNCLRSIHTCHLSLAFCPLNFHSCFWEFVRLYICLLMHFLIFFVLCLPGRGLVYKIFCIYFMQVFWYRNTACSNLFQLVVSFCYLYTQSKYTWARNNLSWVVCGYSTDSAYQGLLDIIDIRKCLVF